MSIFTTLKSYPFNYYAAVSVWAGFTSKLFYLDDPFKWPLSLFVFSLLNMFFYVRYHNGMPVCWLKRITATCTLYSIIPSLLLYAAIPSMQDYRIEYCEAAGGDLSMDRYNVCRSPNRIWFTFADNTALQERLTFALDYSKKQERPFSFIVIMRSRMDIARAESARTTLWRHAPKGTVMRIIWKDIYMKEIDLSRSLLEQLV